MSEDKRVKRVPVKDLHVESGATEISSSPSMEPYLRLAEAIVKEQDPKIALRGISALPLEKRYLWRVASALKWAFCDFDSNSVKADQMTLGESDLDKVSELLRLRPIQFCLFLKALLGEEEMERVMRQAIAMAKQG